MSAFAGVEMPVFRRWSGGRTLATQAALVAVVLALWEAGVRAGAVDAFFWSSPSAIWSTAVAFLPRRTTAYDIWFTFSATVVGFVVGTVAGAAIGLSFWWSRNWAAVFEPLFVVLNAIPKLAFAPLLILVFGIGIASKIALAIALTMIISVLAAYGGVKALDQDLVRLMFTLGARRWQVFQKVVIPSASVWVVSSMRINIGMALAGTIVGEFISSQHGIGKVILYAGSTYEMALIWVGIIILSVMAVLMYAAVGWMERRLLIGMSGQAQD